MFLRSFLGMSAITVCLLTGCSGQPASQVESAQLDTPGDVIQQTPARTWFIDQIIANDSTAALFSKQQPTVDRHNDERIAEMRKSSPLVLPDIYWTLYKQNLDTLQYGMEHQHDDARIQYIVAYHNDLSRLDDNTLKLMSISINQLDEKTRSLWKARMDELSQRYQVTSQAAFKTAVNNNARHMAALDREYGLCTRRPDCWDEFIKK